MTTTTTTKFVIECDDNINNCKEKKKNCIHNNAMSFGWINVQQKKIIDDTRTEKE